MQKMRELAEENSPFTAIFARFMLKKSKHLSKHLIEIYFISLILISFNWLTFVLTLPLILWHILCFKIAS
ncbi:MAG: hypothetical protein CTY27_02575 [Methylotenera sp.]|nr:MAG: hypothetical protein CTY27_02575 [Methylotenera sp.]